MPNIPSIKIGNTTYNVKDTTAREHLVEVSTTQPSSPDNRLWIKDAGNEYEIPTYEEFSEVKNTANERYENITESTEALMDFQNSLNYNFLNDSTVIISGDNVTAKSLGTKKYCYIEQTMPIPANTDYLTISYTGFTGTGVGGVRIGASTDNGETYSWKKILTNSSGDSYLFTCGVYTNIKVALYVSMADEAAIDDYVTYNKLMVNSGITVKEYTRAKIANDTWARKQINKMSEAVGDDEIVGIFVEDAYYNYYNNTLTKMAGAGAFSMTGYEDLTGVKKIDYQLYKYIDTNYSRAVAYLVFFDKNKNFISAVTDIEGDASNGVITGEMIPPAGAKYVVASKLNSATQYLKLKLDLTEALLDQKKEIEKIENEKIFFDDLVYGYVRKINLIGDSITQGAGVEDPDNDSYAGILRKMFFIENDMLMNWGFESFTMKNDFQATVKMVDVSSRNGFSRTWNGTTCYGSEELSSSSDGAYILFTIRDEFNYMKVSYKDGVTGVFSVYAGDTLLTTVTVTSGTVQAALSDPIDISSYDPGTVFKITRDSGTVTVSGVELGYDTDYPTFNNYGRAGIGIGVVTGTLLTQESDCDILIYALGVNSTVSTETLNQIKETIQAVNPSMIIVLSLCMKSEEKNNIDKIPLLKDFADSMGATFIDMYSIIPKTGTDTDETFFNGDGVHPSALGHRCIADRLGKALHLSARSSGLTQKVFGMWGS